jgi:hypothetical protein
MMALMSSAPLLATLTTLQKVGIVAGIVVRGGWLAVRADQRLARSRERA